MSILKRTGEASSPPTIAGMASEIRALWARADMLDNAAAGTPEATHRRCHAARDRIMQQVYALEDAAMQAEPQSVADAAVLLILAQRNASILEMGTDDGPIEDSNAQRLVNEIARVLDAALPVLERLLEIDREALIGDAFGPSVWRQGGST